MNIVVILVSAAVGGILAVLGAVILEMVSGEVQGRLPGICFLLLRWARRRLPEELRGPVHDDEWLPELHFILRRGEGRPITRIVQGLAFSLSLLLKTDRVAKAIGPSRRRPHVATLNRIEEAREELHELLDEVDDILEESAEEYVRQYVQKGGE